MHNVQKNRKIIFIVIPVYLHFKLGVYAIFSLPFLYGCWLFHFLCPYAIWPLSEKCEKRVVRSRRLHSLDEHHTPEMKSILQNTNRILLTMVECLTYPRA